VPDNTVLALRVMLAEFPFMLPLIVIPPPIVTEPFKVTPLFALMVILDAVLMESPELSVMVPLQVHVLVDELQAQLPEHNVVGLTEELENV